MLHDTHFHLDLIKNPEGLIREINEKKIYTIAVTNLPQLFKHTAKLCEGSKYLRPALGYHPELAHKYNNQVDLFKDLVNETRYIGEIGLDNHKKTAGDFADQKKIFETIIDKCGSVGDKILTIHSRKAEQQVIDIIGNNFPGKAILHWYSGSLKDLEKALSYGFYLSINYNMTKSANGNKIIEQIPIDRILLETDGPFTIYNNEPFTPVMTSLIKKGVDKIKGTSSSQEYLSSNFKQLLSI